MRIGILGPLDVRDAAARPIEVGGPRLRALLIRLALDAGPYGLGRAPDRRPLGRRAAVRRGQRAAGARVAAARRAGVRDAVESRPGGYRLAVDPGDVDAVAFERLVTRGALPSGTPAGAADTLRRALGLWRGPALADVERTRLRRAARSSRLDELRLGRVEDRIDAELALGPGAHWSPSWRSSSPRHPLRERLRGQLMRALDAAGRQADALTAYEDTRRALADELGVDPSPELAAVHLDDPARRRHRGRRARERPHQPARSRSPASSAATRRSTASRRCSAGRGSSR